MRSAFRLMTLAQAARRLRRSPGYTLTTLIVLALGVGAVTAIFSVVYGVLMRPYGFEGRGKLVVWHETVREMSASTPLLPANYRHYHYIAEHAHDLESSALLQPGSFAITVGHAHPELVRGLTVTAGFFRMLGQPVRGRAFLPEEDQKGRNREVILTDVASRHFFGNAQNVLGRTLTVDGTPMTVVGTMPASFKFPTVSLMPGQPVDNSKPYGLFTPLVPQPEELTESVGDFNYLALGRLRPGVTVPQAQAELDGLAKRVGEVDRVDVHLGVAVEPFAEEITGGVSKSLILLLLAVGGVLLVGCVNLANLQLARSVAQSGEHALRAALGAARGRLVADALGENLLLAGAGVCLALPVAWGGVRLLVALAPAGLPRLGEVRLSLPVLAIAAALSFGTCLLFGLVPAWRAGTADPLKALGSGGVRVAGEGRGAARLRNSLLIAEIACSVILLVATGLLAHSFGRLLTSARGLGAEPVTMARVDLSDPRYVGDGTYTANGQDAPSQARDAIIERSLSRLAALPGVQSAAITSALPLTGEINIDGVMRPDHPLPIGEVPIANLRRISPGYFTALGIRIVSGRGFTGADRENPHVAILSEATARAAWPGENPVGHLLHMFNRDYTVVGVAADARINDAKHDTPVLYFPFWDYPPFNPVFLVRGAGISGPEVRQAIWSVDPQVAIPTLLPLRVQSERSLGVERFQTLLVSSFGAAALLLAALGVYGVLGYGVNLRMREWGLRMALGSSRGRLVRRVLLDAGRPALVGVLLGSVGALAAGRWLQSLLYGSKSGDGWVLTGSLLLIGIAVLLAALPSALRASGADPAGVLRGE